MNHIKIAKQLIKLANSLVSFDEEELMQYFDIVKKEYQSYVYNFKSHHNSKYDDEMDGWGWWLDYNQWIDLGELKFEIKENNKIVIFNGQYPQSNMPGGFILTVDIDKKNYNFEMKQAYNTMHMPDYTSMIEELVGTNKYNQLKKRIIELQKELNDLKNVFQQNKIQKFNNKESFKNLIRKLFKDINSILNRITEFNNSCIDIYDEIGKLDINSVLDQEVGWLDTIEKRQDKEIQKELGRFKGIKEVNRRNHEKSVSYYRSKKHDKDKKQREIKRKQQHIYKNNQQENNEF